ncbi:nickel/cobalt transporter [Testudinibacter sp. TR-2022]|uniref:nickel/cobalt transporter n=1 Tax=Testudinibacter sp. TR-2022 TaxID=2585029 RepID=UPI00111AE3ED|nr:nickel/cobalt transporter [Testudinibacter sp. TR-2022]TNH04072.1 nickel/cobalt transporter [Pasteurellaceae bacterium Phil31]TNH09753.1 nickel/cobalt transporter [Testudinibacter sp. TR-2022]TNH10984.1 nickel/cobalt transporter [Testudinibacter sp. TR-2022]TNH14745.1 nickel/cobalt transporter [Testudinibacter sp. TR-2022]TNH20562.1 nickel/cobalt transporter [Testudinibacter sp. TR-2022]
MSVKFKAVYLPLLLLAVLLAILLSLYPHLLAKTVEWQREFNQLISTTLKQINQQPSEAGSWLVVISFAYGFLHAVGPGHGKFILSGYLATHPIRLKTSIRLTLLASLLQGVVAVAVISLIVVVLTLSAGYFRLTQLWLERISFMLIIALGGYWLIKNSRQIYRTLRQTKPQTAIGNITQIRQLDAELQIKPCLISPLTALSVTNKSAINQCGCGHQHLADPAQINHLHDWKPQLMVVLSIGIRPCSGAIFVLFLAYMLDLYLWGVVATMAMALGTGSALTLFGLLVLYTRDRMLKFGKGYFSAHVSAYFPLLVKMLFGLILITLGSALLHGTTLPISGGAALFSR